jgi:hypothetical protein
MRILILIPLLFLITGCTSAVLKSGCGHINGTHVTIPYVGGTADGNAYGCYMGCIGPNCKAPDYAALATIMAEYVKDASSNNQITTTGPAVVTVTPIVK